jgi:hypothetical protein
MRKGTALYEEVLGRAIVYITNDSGRKTGQYNALDENHSGLFGISDPYSANMLPPRDRSTLLTLFDYYKYFAFGYAKQNKPLPEKIARIDGIVRDLIENMLPLMQSAQNATDRDEAALSKTLAFTGSAGRTQTPPPPVPPESAPPSQTTAPGQGGPSHSDIAEQLRRVRGNNPNMPLARDPIVHDAMIVNRRQHHTPD